MWSRRFDIVRRREGEVFAFLGPNGTTIREEEADPRRRMRTMARPALDRARAVQLPVRPALGTTAVCVVMGLALAAANEPSEFVFDRERRVVRWRRDTPFRRDSGEIPFSAITGLSRPCRRIWPSRFQASTFHSSLIEDGTSPAKQSLERLLWERLSHRSRTQKQSAPSSNWRAAWRSC